MDLVLGFQNFVDANVFVFDQESEPIRMFIELRQRIFVRRPFRVVEIDVVDVQPARGGPGVLDRRARVHLVDQRRTLVVERFPKQ